MFLEGFIGDELRRIDNERHRRINPVIASFQTTNRTPSGRTARERFGAAMIRAGARVSGSRVNDCLEDVLKPASAHS